MIRQFWLTLGLFSIAYIPNESASASIRVAPCCGIDSSSSSTGFIDSGNGTADGVDDRQNPRLFAVPDMLSLSSSQTVSLDGNSTSATSNGLVNFFGVENFTFTDIVRFNLASNGQLGLTLARNSRFGITTTQLGIGVGVIIDSPHRYILNHNFISGLNSTSRFSIFNQGGVDRSGEIFVSAQDSSLGTITGVLNKGVYSFGVGNSIALLDFDGDDSTLASSFESFFDFTLSPIDAVPEPESWFMLLVGFFGVGVVVRGKKRNLGLISIM